MDHDRHSSVAMFHVAAGQIWQRKPAGALYMVIAAPEGASIAAPDVQIENLDSGRVTLISTQGLTRKFAHRADLVNGNQDE